MTSPITPDPNVHTRTPSSAGTSDPSAIINALKGILGGLPEMILKGVVAFIKQETGVDLSTLLAAFEGIDLSQPRSILNFIEALIAEIPGVGPLINMFINFLTGGTKTSGSQTDLQNELKNIPLIGDLVKAFSGGGGGPLAEIESWVTALEKLIGLGGGSNSGTTTGGGSPVTSNTFSLQELLGLLGTDTTVSASQLKQLAPSTSPNVLPDPNFDTSSFIQGQGNWCWDGWIGTGASAGVNSSIRTVRPGLITIYNIIGTSAGVYMMGGEAIDKGGSGIILEYLRTPQYHDLIDWALLGTDQTCFEWINVPYPAAAYPMGSSVQAGATWLMNHIKQTSGQFIFVMDSQGNQVGAAVYDELRFGSMQDHRDRLLAAVAVGNLRREAGHTFPGYPDPAPGTSGMCDVALMTTGPYTGMGNPDTPAIGNLVDTEDLWWDLCVAGDYFACTPINGVTVVPPVDAIGGNVGCIGGLQGRALREFYGFVNQSHTGVNLINVLTAFVGGNQIYTQINNLGHIESPHNVYRSEKPFAAQGDDRTFMEVGLDYINSFSHLVSPPAEGVRHQLMGTRVAVQPFQVVTAGAQTMWINVVCPGPAILVCVNAYDTDGNLVATVTADQAVISDPEPSSNWTWQPLKAEFVMPPGAATACIVLDVEPMAMTTGIVWFDDAEFEVSSLIDSALLGNIASIPQLSATSVAGPQGIADMLTAIQNIIDGQASANSGTQLTGVELAALFGTQADLALNASTGYDLGVIANQILSNVSTQPLYNGLQPTGEVTFSLQSFTAGSVLPSYNIPSGTSVMGFINCAQAVKKGFIKFMAKSAGGAGTYVNVWKVSKTTGNMSILYSTGDIATQIPNGTWGWITINLAVVNQIPVALGDLVCLEIVGATMSLDVAAEQLAIPNDVTSVPQNLCATRTVASSGGVSPAAVSASSLTYSASNIPFICFGVKDVPVNYQPPTQTNFSSGGMYTFPIPSYVIDDYIMGKNDLLDLVGIGGGGSGGDASGSSLSVNYGQGGTGGSWDAKTVAYGVDIPSSVTALNVLVGAGGPGPTSDGSTTLVGYGAGTPTFDAFTDGGNGNGTSHSWNHTATAGATVLVFIDVSYGTFNVTHGGVTMSPAGLAYNNNSGANGALYAYERDNVPGGPQPIVVTTAKASNIVGQSVSYVGVSSVARAASVFGNGTALSHTATCESHQMIVQAFGNLQGQLSGIMGGTQRGYGYYYKSPYYQNGVAVNDSMTSTTFAATDSVTDPWCSIALVLNPSLSTVLIKADGGFAGGTQNVALNPANSNLHSTGLAPVPAGEEWAGRTYYGGSDTTARDYPGNAPGGGSAGSDQKGTAAAGADGAAWITVRQS